MNTTLLASYIMAVIALLITPGPVMALVTGTAARHGYLSALMTILGTHLASLLLIALATLMLVGLFSLSPQLLNGLGFAGACYIGFISVAGLRRFHAPLTSTTTTGAGSFVSGFVTGIANPKDILFFLNFFPQFLAVSNDFLTSMGLLCLIWVALDFLMLSLYAFVVSSWLTAKRRLQLEWLTLIMLIIISICSALYNGFKIIALVL